jgi:hypothetical protein
MDYKFNDDTKGNLVNVLKYGFEFLSLTMGLKCVMRYENSSILVFHKMNNIKNILAKKLPLDISEKIINYTEYNSIQIKSARIIQKMYRSSEIYRKHQAIKALAKGAHNLVTMMNNEKEYVENVRINQNKQVIVLPNE